jgi:predicted RNase H-like HicB family nuclease
MMLWIEVEMPIVVEETPSGVHVAKCPLIHGLMTVGHTRDQALFAVQKAIRDLESARSWNELNEPRESGSSGSALGATRQPNQD